MSDRNEERPLQSGWTPGVAPVAVVMISYNEEHNMESVIENIDGWAQEVFLVDSFSTDRTVDIAVERGVRVYQRGFEGFGDQWNFALRELPISAEWTMKLDPDERLTDELKASIHAAIRDHNLVGLNVSRRLWFLGVPLGIRQSILRVWRTGECRFTSVKVNEHPEVEGKVSSVVGDLEHHDSPDLHHWYDKQNRYSTAEAYSFNNEDLCGVKPRLFGSRPQRIMFFKRLRRKVPFRGLFVLLYCLLIQGGWRRGRVGWIWARLRSDVYRMADLKEFEMRHRKIVYSVPAVNRGPANYRATQVPSE